MSLDVRRERWKTESDDVAYLESLGWNAVERSDGRTAKRVDGTRGIYAASLAELVRRIETIR